LLITIIVVFLTAFLHVLVYLVPLPIVQDGGWAPPSVWTGVDNRKCFIPSGVRDRTSRQTGYVILAPSIVSRAENAHVQLPYCITVTSEFSVSFTINLHKVRDKSKLTLHTWHTRKLHIFPPLYKIPYILT